MADDMRRKFKCQTLSALRSPAYIDLRTLLHMLCPKRVTFLIRKNSLLPSLPASRHSLRNLLQWRKRNMIHTFWALMQIKQLSIQFCHSKFWLSFNKYKSNSHMLLVYVLGKIKVQCCRSASSNTWWYQRSWRSLCDWFNQSYRWANVQSSVYKP